MKAKLLCLVAVLSLGVSMPSGAFAADLPTATEKKSGVNKRVGAEEFDKLRAIILDVRTEAEFKAGHIPGAKNIHVNSPDFDAQVAKLDKSKTYLVLIICEKMT
ncbi:MAG TPA: rhodanese-like domain-containing protein [Candidatus Limnocylindria bacterium]|nr:rhodanese-like domain-containing protein [Candidatus Limnocylindria bacterium]